MATMIIPVATTEMKIMIMKTIQSMTITQLQKIQPMTITQLQKISTDDDNTASEDHNDNETNEGNGDSQQDINNEEDAQDIYDELLEQCYPTDYLCAHADELDYCGSYPQEDEYCEDSEDSSDTNEGNDPPEVNDRDEYSEWAQGVNNAVLRESLPFPYIFAHMDDLGYRDGSNRFSSAGSSLSGYSSNASQGGCGSMSYSGSTSRGSASVSSSGNTPHFESCFGRAIPPIQVTIQVAPPVQCAIPVTVMGV